jgi:hypothetical protein
MEIPRDTGFVHCNLKKVSDHQEFKKIKPLISRFCFVLAKRDRHGGLVVRVLDYRSGCPGSIPSTTRFSGKKKKGKQVVGLERGPLSLMSTTEELLGRKVAAPI